MAAAVGIALSAALMALLLRKNHPEFSVLISLTACVILFLLTAKQLLTVRDALNAIADKSGIDPKLSRLLFRSLGIACLGQFSSSLCRDAGESAVANVLDFCTKLTILLFSLPILTALFERLAAIAEGL